MDKAKLPQWQIENGRLARIFSFDTYVDGISFALKVAFLAEKLNHHPEMIIGYKKITISYFTHDSRQLTDKDFAAAEQVDML